MNTRLLPLFTIVLSASLASPAFGATTVTYDFQSETLGDLFTGGVTGWSQATPNPSAFGTTFPLAYIASTGFGSGPTNSGHLGTQFANTADNSPTTVSGTLGLSGSVIGSLTLNLAILDNTADSFPGRDAFSVSVVSPSGAGIARLGLTPTVGQETQWDISIGVNGAPLTPTVASVQSLSGYIFQLDFSTASTSFRYGPQGGSPSVLIGDRAAPFTFEFGEIAMTHTPMAAAGTSANTLVFDNIVATIPEPSSALLGLASLVLLCGCRRR